MHARNVRALKRCAAAFLLAAGLGGCAVYGPPSAAYDPYYGGGGYSTYVGPPVELNLGLGYYGGHRHYSSPRHGHYRGKGWGGGRSHHGGRRGHGRGRH